MESNQGKGFNKFWIISLYSFVKRFFYFNSTLYGIISALPVLLSLNSKVSKRGLLYSGLIIIFFVRDYDDFLMYLSLILLLPFSIQFKKVNFESVLEKGIFLFFLICFYGIYQNLFGYSSIELAWIRSGLSVVVEEGYFIREDIRPFSTFSSLVEFGLFISIYLYYFSFIKKNILLSIFAFVMLIVIGSRGVLLSVMISFLLTYVFKKYNWKGVLKSIFLSFLSYLIIAVILPELLRIISSDNRMLVFGTFNYRFLMVVDFFNNINIEGFFIGGDFTDIYDNMYLVLVNSSGICATLILFRYFLKMKFDEKSFFFTSLLFNYMFYSDILFSFYFMFPFFFANYSCSNSKNNNNNETIS